MRLLRGVSLAVFVSLAGCSSNSDAPAATSCAHDSDCANGLVCLFGSCATKCAADRDCPVHARCLETSDGAGCVDDSIAACSAGCPDGTSCAGDGTCRTECTKVKLACLDDQVCDDGAHCVGSDASHDTSAAGQSGSGGESGSSGASGHAGTTAGGHGGSGGAGASGEAGAGGASGSAGMSVGGASGSAGMSVGGASGSAGMSGGASGSAGMSVGGASGAAGSSGSGGSTMGTLGATHVAVGTGRSCAIKSGVVSCWGGNVNPLDVGASAQVVPTAMPVEGLGPMIQVSAGATMVCALPADHHPWCWGDNGYGQIGVSGAPTMPVAVNDTATYAEIRAGFRTTCGRHDDGSVSCWGLGSSGELGNGDTMSSDKPVAVSGIQDAIQLATDAFSCALHPNGHVSCWGGGSKSPVDIGVTNGVEVRVGASNITRGFVRTSDGSILTFEPETDGSGFGMPVPIDLPVVSGASINDFTVAASICAHYTDGSIRCADFDDGGFQPFQQVIVPDGMKATEISAGYSQFSTALVNCFLREDGAAYCWGEDDVGEVGDDAPWLFRSAVKVTGAQGATDVRVFSYSVAFSESGQHFAMTGDEPNFLSGETSMPMSIVALDGFSSVRLGDYEDNVAYAVTSGAGVTFFGNPATSLADYATNDFTDAYPGVPWDVGQRADGSLVFLANFDGAGAKGEFGVDLTNTPSKAGQFFPLAVPMGAKLIASPLQGGQGDGHVCYLASGQLSCWGTSEHGEIGDGTKAQIVAPPKPVVIPGVTNVLAACVGYAHTCAIGDDTHVYCWGDNGHGQCGGTGEEYDSPTQVSGLPATLTDITCIEGHTCAWGAQTGAWCWGENAFGQMGDGALVDRRTPAQPMGLPTDIAKVAIGQVTSCALTSTNAVYCWGSSYAGECGTGVIGYQPNPVQVVGF